jgi:predicted nucleic acid-binding protein
MVKALFDTNILIDHLSKVPPARVEIGRYRDRAISQISWIEIMVGADSDVAAATREFLDGFELVRIDDAIAEEAVMLRKAHKMKLPDAIIWASARARAMLLVTRNAKDFPPGDPGVRMPYSI